MRYHKNLKLWTRNAKVLVVSFFIFNFSFLIFLSGCGRRAPIVKKIKPLMGTWVSIKVYDSLMSPKKLDELIDKAFSGMERIESLMSTFSDDSEVSRINRLKADESMKLSLETLMLINRANEIHQMTEGAFDVTVYPLVELWGFYEESGKAVPSKDQIEKTLELVGEENVLLDKEYGYLTLSKDGVKLDLGGIAKGFAVDEAVRILKREGIRNALIDAGGDIYCLGQAPDGGPWKVGIKHPRKNSILTTLRLKDIAVATSGDYEKFFSVDKKRFSHIIDPRTGYPAEEGLMSVTVLSRDCVSADGLATALSVLGSREGLRLVNRLDDVEAILVGDNQGSLEVGVSEGLDGLYEFKK